MSEEKKITLTEHLLELRKRLIYCLLTFMFFFCINYFYAKEIYNFLLQPLLTAYKARGMGVGRIIYTNPAEAFVTYLRLSFLSSLFFSLPIIITQLYLFAAPGLFKSEKKIFLSLTISSLILFLLGCALLYYLVLPIAFEFFLGFEATQNLASMNIALESRISEYLDLVVKLFFGFGIAFQLPILLIVLVKFEILSVESLAKQRKYWIVIIFIIAAILTPPDVFSQVALALPMILLFEISLLFAKKINKNKL